jgi:calpain-7
VTPIIYPQNKDGVPIYNPSGKYIVKLWLNGVARQVVVDDRLPIDAHGRLLCSDTKTSNHRLELWVSIIEKAYMKLCGGYDFPGSNSGVDLFSLTGWIPERIFFPKNLNKARDFETEPERAWERLFSANSFGDCLITVSTTRDLDEAQAERLGLITGHAYAVLDVVQASDGTRLLQVRSLATTI